MFRERLDRIRFVLLVFYHVLVTVLLTAFQWITQKLALLARFIRYQLPLAKPPLTSGSKRQPV